MKDMRDANGGLLPKHSSIQITFDKLPRYPQAKIILKIKKNCPSFTIPICGIRWKAVRSVSPSFSIGIDISPKNKPKLPLDFGDNDDTY